MAPPTKLDRSDGPASRSYHRGAHTKSKQANCVTQEGASERARPRSPARNHKRGLADPGQPEGIGAQTQPRRSQLRKEGRAVGPAQGRAVGDSPRCRRIVAAGSAGREGGSKAAAGTGPGGRTEDSR
jgi:hypothetical protein